MKRLLPLLALVALAGCGDSGGKTTSSATTSQVTTVTSTAETRPVSLDLFFLQKGKVAAVHREARTSKSPLLTAIEQLAVGPTSSERAAGLTSEMPTRLGFQATVQGGIADVSLSAGLSRPALAQLTYTLTQLGNVRGVRVGGKTYKTGDFEGLAPAILIESPSFGEAVRSPVRVTGTANTFEATFTLELRTGGRLLGQKTVTATSGSGARGTFAATFTYSVSEETRGELRAYELSAQNGKRINTVSVPISLLP